MGDDGKDYIITELKIEPPTVDNRPQRFQGFLQEGPCPSLDNILNMPTDQIS